MRKLFITILFMAFSPLLSNAQGEGPIRVYNFIYNEGDIYWFKVYQIDSTVAVRYFKNQQFTKCEDNYYQTTVSLKNYSNEKYMNRAFMLNDDCTIHFIFEAKKDRYRITVTNIIWKTTISGGIFIDGGEAGISTTQSDNLKSYAFTKKGKRKWEPGEDIPKQLDFALQALFNATESTQAKIIKEDF